MCNTFLVFDLRDPVLACLTRTAKKVLNTTKFIPEIPEHIKTIQQHPTTCKEHPRKNKKHAKFFQKTEIFQFLVFLVKPPSDCKDHSKTDQEFGKFPVLGKIQHVSCWFLYVLCLFVICCCMFLDVLVMFWYPQESFWIFKTFLAVLVACFNNLSCSYYSCNTFLTSWLCIVVDSSWFLLILPSSSVHKSC